MISSKLLHKKEDLLRVHNAFYYYPKLFHVILEQFESISDIIQNYGLLSKHFNLKNPQQIPEKLKNIPIEKHLRFIEKNNIELLPITAPDYPATLKEIATPPILLFVKGNKNCLLNPGLGIVGPRKPSDYGKRVTQQFTKHCCQEFTIVSGFATGIDAIAHETCLDENRPTIAVMGVGLDQCYPSHHRQLAQKILEKDGLLISEIPLFNSPQPFHFPLRNRVISGLSRGILVCEAKEKSGSLITAQHALEQNREVFTVPGDIFSPQSNGCHQLIKDGAKCTTKPEDIFEELNIKQKQSVSNTTLPLFTETPPPTLNPDEAHIFSLLKKPTHIDTIIETSTLPLPKVLQCLTFLEIKNLVYKQDGNTYSKQA